MFYRSSLRILTVVTVTDSWPPSDLRGHTPTFDACRRSFGVPREERRRPGGASPAGPRDTCGCLRRRRQPSCARPPSLGLGARLGTRLLRPAHGLSPLISVPYRRLTRREIKENHRRVGRSAGSGGSSIRPGSTPGRPTTADNGGQVPLTGGQAPRGSTARAGQLPVTVTTVLRRSASRYEKTPFRSVNDPEHEQDEKGLPGAAFKRRLGRVKGSGVRHRTYVDQRQELRCAGNPGRASAWSVSS